MNFKEEYESGSNLWTGNDDIDRTVEAAIKSWEKRTGWKADFSVVQGFCIAINERCVELQKENEWLRGRINRMCANCGWCQETRSESGSFSPCPLHEGAERGMVGKDEITGRFWFFCPNCGKET